jgi:hypothetical protein
MLDRARRAAREDEKWFTAALQPSDRGHLLALLRQLAAGQDLPVGVHPGLPSQSVVVGDRQNSAALHAPGRSEFGASSFPR